MRLFILALLVVSSQASAEIYQCTANGKTTFSDRPCSTDAKIIEVKTDSQVGSFGYDGITKAHQMIGRDNRNREISRSIKRTEDEISAYNDSLSYELQLLKLKKQRANNNLAGATWEESISQEMNAVASKYRLKIDDARARIAELKEAQADLRVTSAY